MSAATSVSIPSFGLGRVRPRPLFSPSTSLRDFGTGGAARHAAARFGLQGQPRALQTSRSCRRLVGRTRASATSVGGSAHGGDAAFGSGLPEASASGCKVDALDNTRDMVESKWLVITAFTIRILWKHDIESLWAGIGPPINYFLSVGLKYIFNQQRPVHAKKSGPGMPSSHSQSFFYMSSYFILSLILELGVNVLTVSAGMIIFTISSYLSSLRVSKQFHTPRQVVVGAIFGSAYAALWLWSWNAFAQAVFASSVWFRTLLILVTIVYQVYFVRDVTRAWSKRSFAES